MINFDGPDEEALALEAYSTWTRLFELLPHYSWIVDRFHLSTMAYQRAAHARDYDFGWLEDRLLVLGFHVVLCTRRDETFEAARADRLLVSGRPETSTTICRSSFASRRTSGRSPLDRDSRSSSST